MEKLLVMSNFSFSHSVFKRLVLHTCKNQGLFGKGLNLGQYGNKQDIPSNYQSKLKRTSSVCEIPKSPQTGHFLESVTLVFDLDTTRSMRCAFIPNLEAKS